MSQKLKSATIIDNTTPITDISNNEILTPGEKAKSIPIIVDNKETSMDVPFWTNNPNILFDGKYILEFFPVDTMTYEQKLNAVSRTIIVLSIVGFLFSKSVRTLIVGAITVFAIFLMFYYHKKESFKNNEDYTEGFENPADAVLAEKNLPINKEGVFMSPSAKNPMSNVLMTDYDYNPNKKPAPPAFNHNITEEINKKTKQMISELHKDQPDITKKLYKDLGEEFEFEQSLRQFVSNPSTTIPNDQSSFAEFCYGSMISCKEGNLFACARNKSNYSIY